MTRLLPLLLVACGGVELMRAPEPEAPEAAPPPPPARAVPVQAIVGTSGGDATRALDGTADTWWAPEGDPTAEGLLVRFEEPVPVRRATITPCGDAGVMKVTDYVNGKLNATGTTIAGETTITLPDGLDARTWFVRIDEATGTGCIAEVGLEGDEPMAFQPPRVRPATVEATSTLEPEDAYLVDYLFDGRIDFGWVEGADGDGPGEIVTVTLERSVALSGVQIWNGYQRSADHFARNARARRIRVSADGGPWTDLDLKDAPGPQTARLLVPLQGKELRVALDSSYPGSQYADLVISELRFVDREGPFGLELGTEVPRVRRNKRALTETPLGTVIDRHWHSRCEGGEESGASATFKLRSNNSFVWYEQRVDAGDDGEPGTTREEVFDGAWVPSDRRDGWQDIILYGRRHRTEATFQPYAESEETEQTRVAGGRVRIAHVDDLKPDQLAAWAKRWSDGPLATQVACVLLDGEDPRPLPAVRKALVDAGAIIVEGAAMSDLLVPTKRD